MAKPLFFDRDLDDPPSPFALQRCPDPELETFCPEPLAALELAPCITIETAESLCLQPPGQAMTQQLGRAQLRRGTVAVAPDLSKPFETKGRECLDLVASGAMPVMSVPRCGSAAGPPLSRTG